MQGDVTVILNGYRRPEYLKEQHKAVLTQTVQPAEIMIWQNRSPETPYFEQFLLDNMKVASCNQNLGVWARFAYALMAKTKYVCIIDDDTIPGKKWLENCIHTIENHPNVGLLGTIGLRFKTPDTYYGADRYGWDGVNPTEPTEVDIVGHAWFFKRETLSIFWRELPDPKFTTSGEDIHFSWMLQKYSDLRTFIPPHPPEDIEKWGSLKAMQYGGDHKATAIVHGVGPMDDYYRHCTTNGFKIVNQNG